MVQLMPYSFFVSSNETDGNFIEVSEGRLHTLIRSILDGVKVDEAWYRERYRDVDEAIRRGRFASAKAHYVEVGYFEDRLPRPVEVDEAWYLGKNGDVAEAIRRGAVQSVEDHFHVAGFREGRMPCDGWSL